MKYDFDREIDRAGTGSVKYDHPDSRLYADTVPMWVADMDFAVLPEIRQAIHGRADNEIYGYTMVSDDYLAAVCGWMERRHGFSVAKESIVVTNGVVSALKLAVLAFTSPEDRVAVLSPVYYPFGWAAEENGRKVVRIPLQEKGGLYTIDFDLLDKSLDGVSMLIFCNPHNPVGRVWTEAELKELYRICSSHDVMIVSDEIHQDLTAPGVTFSSLWKAVPESRSHSIVCTAPSKTFNLAGLATSNILIDDVGLRKRFCRTASACGACSLNVFGLDACQAAYTYGDVWVDELNDYIQENFVYLENFLAENLPSVHMSRREGLYLCWVDFRSWGLSETEYDTFFKNDAHIFLDGGTMFGQEGEGFQRFNLACTRRTLKRACRQLLYAARERGFS